MKILHTSDWHIGRTFHAHSTVENLRIVFAGLVDVVREKAVDVVVVAGDVFDSATPAAEHFRVLAEVLTALHATGAKVVMTSGNHDAPARLGFQSEFAGLAGIHVLTDPQRISPVTIQDDFGPVHFYGIPYLEPSLIRHLFPGVELRTHAQALAHAMGQINADRRDRGGRSIAISHCFAMTIGTGPVGTVEVGTHLPDAGERDLSSGGVDVVPVSVFDGPDYVALGHIHGRQELSRRVRYSGAPLHYSFSETSKPRGGWLVDLDADGLSSVAWIDLPIPRRLAIIEGTIDDLLSNAELTRYEDHWVSAIFTDQVRPMDGMRRLQTRFPFAALLDHRPAVSAVPIAASYTERVKGRTDLDVLGGFLQHVRNGKGPTDGEWALIADVIGVQAGRQVVA